MKVELFIFEDSEGLKHHRVYADGKQIAGIGPLDECPEDAIIGRDLVDGKDILCFIRLGWDAAQQDAGLEVSTKSCTEEEWEALP